MTTNTNTDQSDPHPTPTIADHLLPNVLHHQAAGVVTTKVAAVVVAAAVDNRTGVETAKHGTTRTLSLLKVTGTRMLHHLTTAAVVVVTARHRVVAVLKSNGRSTTKRWQSGRRKMQSGKHTKHRVEELEELEVNRAAMEETCRNNTTDTNKQTNKRLSLEL